MLVASHESGGDRGRSECKDKTVTHQVPRHRGEERDGHKKHRGSHREKVRAVEGVFQKPVESRTSRIWTQLLLVVRENPEIKR